MSAPGHFIKLAMPDGAQQRAEKRMDTFGLGDWRADRPMAWAGLAAEEALIAAYTSSRGEWLEPSNDTRYDLGICSDSTLITRTRIEVKTRAVDEGWTDPRRFEWFYVPSHDGRAPIKDVEMVFFCWYSGSQPATLWALGYLAGLQEFLRRSQSYAEGAPLPRGGWAGKGGGYCLEIKQLRPFPRGMFRGVGGA